MIKKLIILIFVTFVLISSFLNISKTIIKYIASNISIREMLLKENNIYNKGTHEPGDFYITHLNENVKLF